MLNKSVEVLKQKLFSNGEKRSLHDFDYDDSEMAQLFLDILNETSFDGMSVSSIVRDTHYTFTTALHIRLSSI